MNDNIYVCKPNLVKVTRPNTGNSDLAPTEHIVGYLVDVDGNDVESPEIGKPIYLSGKEKLKIPWLFASDPVYRLEVYDTHWLVETEQGNQFEIYGERVFN